MEKNATIYEVFMMWRDILKNIQIGSQKTVSRDYVRDEDDETCRERFENMLYFIDKNWETTLDASSTEEEIREWPDEIFCKMLEYINKQSFLFYNPTHEGNYRDLYKYDNAFEFYRDDDYRADITLDLGMGFHLKMTQRMVAVRPNVINIFCQFLAGNTAMLSLISWQINETFNIGGDEFTILLNEEPYDDGVTTTVITKDIEPSYMKTRDWRRF